MSLSSSLASLLRAEGTPGRVEAAVTRSDLPFRAQPDHCLEKRLRQGGWLPPVLRVQATRRDEGLSWALAVGQGWEVRNISESGERQADDGVSVG